MRLVPLLLLLVWASTAFGQVTFTPVPIAFPQIAIGGDTNGQNYVTLIQVVNNNSANTTGHLVLYSDTGSALSAMFDGQGPQSSIDIALTAGEARQIQVTLNGPVTAGWMSISYSPSDALTTVILQFRSGTSLLSEVGVDPAFGTIAATDFGAETDAGLNTGIAIANPSNATLYVLARLWDPGTGSLAASTTVSLQANGHIAKFLTELFPNVLTISQIRARLSLDSCSTSACSAAGGNGLLATAIRLNGDQFTTIPVTERLSGGDTTRSLPQVAFGGPANGLNMKTILYFTTYVSPGVFGTADVFDNDGNPLMVSADGGPLSTSINFTVAANRVSRVVLSGDQTLRSGWIRLTLPSSVNLVANAVFQTFNGTTLASEASVLEAPAIQQGLLYVKTNSGAANVGVAFANSQSAPNTITLDLFNPQGFLAATQNITLPPNGHLARFVTELFPVLASAPDFDGALSIHSPAAFTALALRLTGDKIASLPVAEDGMYRPSITALRITRTQRSPAQVSFDIDVNDYDSDLVTAASTSIVADALIDFGTSGYDLAQITIDGRNMLDRTNGTISGVFQPPHVTGAVPSGTPAVLYVRVYDSAGNVSNVVAFSFKF